MKIISKNNLHQLIFLPRIFPVNCYIVEEESSVTLIDAALPNSYKGIQHAISQIGKPLGAIVLTHIHDDHVGSLDRLHQLYPDVPVYVSQRDARLMIGDMSLDADEPQTKIKGSVPKRLQTRPSVLLHEGDPIGSLQVIATPGHTPGSISLWDTRDQSLIAGDALQTRGGIAVAGSVRMAFPFPALATWSKERALQSARKLVALQPSLLAVGHGAMITDPYQAMQDAIQHAEQRLPSSLSIKQSL